MTADLPPAALSLSPRAVAAAAVGRPGSFSLEAAARRTLVGSVAGLSLSVRIGTCRLCPWAHRWNVTPTHTKRSVLDAAMAQPPPPPPPEHSDTAREPSELPVAPSDLDQARRTSMAAERTWLAWWRAALAASAGALGVGRLAPELLHVAPWPYVLLGCGYASLAIGLLIVGAQRQRELEHALRTGGIMLLHFCTVGLFNVGGVGVAGLSVVVVIAQTLPPPTRDRPNPRDRSSRSPGLHASE